MGFSNVGFGIVHSMAHPLSAVYDIPHGVACAILLTPVLKFNAPSTADKYRDIAVAMGVKNTEDMSIEQARQACIEAVEKLSVDVGIPQKLTQLGVKEEDLQFLSESAFVDACTPGNPRDVSVEAIKEIYKSIM